MKITTTLFASTVCAALLAVGCEQADYDTTTTPPPRDTTTTTPRDRDLYGTEPGGTTTSPGTTQPGTTQPGTTQPGTTQPGMGTGTGTGQQDQQLQQQLEDQLAEQPGLEDVADNVTIQVRNGRVMLTGTVENAQQRTQIESFVRQHAGASYQIDNQLTIEGS